jgi:uncharacterized protein (TIGR03067 family)
VRQEVWGELQLLLDQELNRLPVKYRLAVVLCDLEGRSRKEAARQLQIPEGTLSSRLTTARALLAKRLARHGVTVSAVALAGMLSHNAASAGVPTSVVSSTIKAAPLVAAGQTTASGLISIRVATLTEGVLKAMLLRKLKIATAVLLIVTLTALGVGYLCGPSAVAQQPADKKEKEPPAEKKDAHKDTPEEEAKGKTDPAGVPLEAQLVARKDKYVLDLAGKERKAEKEVTGKLAGTWKVVSAEMDGKEVDEGVKATRWVIAGTTFTAKLPQEGKGEFACKLGEADKRETIDVEVLRAERDGGPKKRVYPGIYSLEGDTLKVCYALPGKERPTTFATKPGSGDSLPGEGGTLFVLKRESGEKK